MATETSSAELRAAQAVPVPLAEHQDQQHAAETPTTGSSEAQVPKKLSLKERLSGRIQAERGTPTERGISPSPEMPKQNEFLEGGKNEPINLTPESQKDIAKRLSERIQALKSLQSKERPLTDLDRILIRAGPEAIQRLEAGNCNSQDASIAFYALHDEIIQKSLSTANLIKDNKMPAVYKKRFGPFCKYLAESSHMQTQLEASSQKLNTEYTKEIGFDTWNPERIENDLTNLNQLRHNLELSLTGISVEDPLFDQTSTSIYPLEFNKKTGNRLHDAVVDELMGAEGVLTQRFGGKTYFELWEADPIAATQAVYEANQRALTQFAGEAGKDFLKAEAPKPDTGLIEKQAVKLETKPTPEDLQKLTTATTTATAEFNTATTELNTIQSPVEDAQKTLAVKQLAFAKASNTFNRSSELLTPEIERLRQGVELLYGSIQQPDPSLSPEQKAGIQQAIAVTSQNIARIEEGITSHQNRLDQLSQQQIEAELELNEQKENFERAQKEAEEKGLEQARINFDQKKEAKEKAEAELRERQAADEEISPEAKEQARGLRKWNEVARGYERIINARFDQEYAAEYTRERLADTKERPDGQIEGAERIREQIFYLINKEEYDPELARKMLSDEAIARAIIWVYKLDPESITTDGLSLNQLLSDLNTTKEMIREDPEAKDLLEEKAGYEKEIIKLALPNLRSSQFKAGDLLRFMTHEGLKSAERGNPYLALDEYYQAPTPELGLRAESIYREGLGNAEIDLEDNTVTWTGSVPNSTMQGLSRNDLPTVYRITQQISPLNDIYSAEVITDQRFLQSLPDNIHGPTLLPEAIQNAFYDEDDNLWADRQRPGSLTMFSQGSHDNPDETLNELNTIVSPEASKIIAASVADYVLKKTPQERLEILRGLDANIQIPAFRSTVDTPLINEKYVGIPTANAYTIDFDNNGNFFIADKSGNRQQLEAFYQRKLEGFTNKLGVQALNPKQREDLKSYFLTIQQTLGQEILRSLQRR